MLWQSQEQQNVVTLDEQIALQLGDYLDKKEATLSTLIGNLIPSIHIVDSQSNAASVDTFRYSHLSEALEEFSRKVQRTVQTHGPLKVDRCQEVVKKLNEGLWAYVEILESCENEFFQQLEQIGFEYWTADFARASTLIKDELTHRIDDVIWGVRRIREQLKVYTRYSASKRPGWLAWIKGALKREKLLDRTLEPTLHKCNKYLNFKYRKFIDRYNGCLQLQDLSQKSIERFYNFPVLSSLDVDQQDKYRQLFYLLKLWDENNKARILPRHEPVRALRSFSSVDNVLSNFKEYFSAIKLSIFEKSRLIKKQFRVALFALPIRQTLMDVLTSYRSELSILSEVIAGYKRFYLYTSPKGKDYSFKDLHTEDDKKHTYELDKLYQQVNELERVTIDFQASLEKDFSDELTVDSQIHSDVENCIHEMEQPFATEDRMSKECKALLVTLKGLDEVGSIDSGVVSFIRATLTRALCADWKYHVLQDLPLFHHVYNLHQSIDNNLDRIHLNRLQRFKIILDRLEGWIEDGKTVRHAHDIELNINDIKAYLQDFLAHIQRFEKLTQEQEDEGVKDEPLIQAEQALLEYLYVFGQFLHKLKFDDQEHRLIRRQLLFVNQYFDEIKRKIYTPLK